MDLKRFEEMIHNDEFKIDLEQLDKVLSKKNDDQYNYYSLKKAADNYMVSSVFSLFEDMCYEAERLVTFDEYIEEYMKKVNSNFHYSYVGNLSWEEKSVFLNIFKLRAISAYRSALAEIHFKLMCEELYDYTAYAMREDLDQILGVDIVLDDYENDSAFYIHITKQSKFSVSKLNNKSKKKIKVRNIKTDEKSVFQRNFDNHIYAFYDDSGENCTVVNGAYLFKEEYVRKLIEENKGKCGREDMLLMNDLVLAR